MMIRIIGILLCPSIIILPFHNTTPQLLPYFFFLFNFVVPLCTCRILLSIKRISNPKAHWHTRKNEKLSPTQTWHTDIAYSFIFILFYTYDAFTFSTFLLLNCSMLKIIKENMTRQNVCSCQTEMLLLLYMKTVRISMCVDESLSVWQCL